MTEKILCVDDEPEILRGFRRVLRKSYNLDGAVGGGEALRMIRESGPYAVVVSDLRMPDMDGIRLLAHVREMAPDSVRVMLTGKADVGAAIDAINKGQLFRFLTKPCPADVLARTLEDALAQHRLITAERTLLERTLRGSVKVLTDVLALVNPVAFSRGTRIMGYVRHMARRLDPADLWQYELAALLSQIGCVTLPTETLEKISANQSLTETEKELYAAHPQIGFRLLANIPRLETVARMIAGQQNPPPTADVEDRDEQRRIDLGSKMLRVALDFDGHVSAGICPRDAIQILLRREGEYDPALLRTLRDASLEEPETIVKSVSVNSLNTLMVIDEDVRAKNGLLLVSKGQAVTYVLLKRLQSFARGIGVHEPIRVRLPRAPVENAETKRDDDETIRPAA